MIDIKQQIEILRKFHYKNYKNNKYIHSIYNIPNEFILIPVERNYIYSIIDHFIRDKEFINIIGINADKIRFPCTNYIFSHFNCPICIYNHYQKDNDIISFRNIGMLIKTEKYNILKTNNVLIAKTISKYIIENQVINIPLKIKISTNNFEIYPVENLKFITFDKSIFFNYNIDIVNKISKRIDDIISYLKNKLEKTTV